MTTIGLLGAIVAGMLSLLSPCSALLLPAFFAYAFSSKTELISRTLVFFLGLAAVLAPVGASAGALGMFFVTHRHALILFGGTLMIILGVIVLLGGGFQIPGVSTLSRAATQSSGSWLSTFLLGCVYGFAGFCAGPMLGAVLTTALVSSNVAYGIAVMAAYAFGMSVPLFVLALLWDSLPERVMRGLRGRTVQLGSFQLNTMNVIAGLFFIALGVLYIATQGTSTLGGWFSTETQAQLQERVAALVAHISDAWALLALAVLAAIATAIKASRTPARNTGELPS